MNMTDTGTGYSELALTRSRSMDTVISVLEGYWVCRHGAPQAISADDEYNRKPLRAYLRSHNIQFKTRPARRHNKIGIVERKNRTLKAILSKLNDEKSSATVQIILSRASLLSNLFSGNRLLS